MEVGHYEALVFWALAAISVIPGFFIVVTKDIVRAAFWLLASLSGFAGLYLLLGADFLAIIQVIVYLGGIMILILYGVMLTQHDPVTVRHQRLVNLLVPALTAGMAMIGALVLAIARTGWVPPDALPLAPPRYSTREIGLLLMTDFVLPFEVASVLLLVALIGAAYVARKR